MEGGTNPNMFHYKRPLSRISMKQSADELSYSLDIVGSNESVSEAIAIHTAVAILADHGHDKIIIDINSLSDKIPITQFEKELQNFSKKHGVNMPPEVRQQLKKIHSSVFIVIMKMERSSRTSPAVFKLICRNKALSIFNSIRISRNSRYSVSINPRLLGQRQYCSHTVFEIKMQMKLRGLPKHLLLEPDITTLQNVLVLNVKLRL